MTRYLLDTSVIIDFSKRHEPVYPRVLAMMASTDDIGVCAVTVAEFSTGLFPAQRSQWEQFIQELEYWQISREAAIRAGDYRYTFARQGRTIQTPDALIAAVAWQRGATLVTNNVKDFPMSDIPLLSLLE